MHNAHSPPHLRACMMREATPLGGWGVEFCLCIDMEGQCVSDFESGLRYSVYSLTSLSALCLLSTIPHLGGGGCLLSTSRFINKHPVPIFYVIILDV